MSFAHGYILNYTIRPFVFQRFAKNKAPFRDFVYSLNPTLYSRVGFLVFNYICIGDLFCLFRSQSNYGVFLGCNS